MNAASFAVHRFASYTSVGTVKPVLIASTYMMRLSRRAFTFRAAGSKE